MYHHFVTSSRLALFVLLGALGLVLGGPNSSAMTLQRSASAATAVQALSPAPSVGRLIPVSNAQDIAAAMLTAGSYDVLVMDSSVPWVNQDIQFARATPGEGPITLRADVPGGVILSGTSRLSISGDQLVVKGLRFEEGLLDVANPGENFVVQFRASGSTDAPQATRSRMTDCVISRYGSVGNGKYNWVQVYGQCNAVEHCFFEGHDHNGVTVVVPRRTSAPDYHSIRYNHFRDRTEAPDVADQNWETVRVGTSATSLSASYTVVEHNLFERTNGEAEAISNKSGSNIYRYNTFRSVEGALSLRHGNDCLVVGNYFLGNCRAQTGGIRLNGTGHQILNNYIFAVSDRFGGAIVVLNGDADPALSSYAVADRVLISHNTMVDCRTDGIRVDRAQCGTDCSLLAADGVVVNNLYAGGDLAYFPFMGSPGPGWVSLRNTSSVPLAGMSAGSLASGFTVEAGGLEFDPEAGLWRPTASTPEIAAPVAADAGFAWEDVAGKQRGSSSATVGAQDLGVTPALRHPLSTSEVGPRWLQRYTSGTTIASGGTCVVQAEDFIASVDTELTGRCW